MKPAVVQPIIAPPGSEAPNTLPIATLASTAGEAVTLAGKSATPEIVVLGQQTSNSYGIVSLVLVNPLNVPIRYYGYRMDAYDTRPAAGSISPWYSLKIQNAAGGPWEDNQIGYCGNGGDIMTVRRKEAGRFDVPVPLTATAATVHLECRWKSQGQDVKQEIVSPIISLASP